MRIALDARTLNAAPSGVGCYTENLVRELLAADPEIRFLLVTRRPGLAERFDAGRCEEIVFRAPPRSLRTVHTMARSLRRHEFDLFHGPANLLPTGLRRTGVVTIHDVIPLQDLDLVSHDLWFKLGAGAFWRTYMARAIREADRILTVSETSKDLILERFDHLDADEVVVTPNGVDPMFLAPASGDEEARVLDALDTEAPYVLLVGQGSPRKNHRRAVEAFLSAFAPDSAMRLVLVTRLHRPDEALERLLATPDAHRRVIQLDGVDSPTLIALYRRARIFFFPSYVEGFGLPLLEAMACNTPVLASSRSAPQEVAGDAALLCSPFSMDALVAGLRELDTDETLRTELVRRGRARVETFTYARCAARTLEAYRGLLEARR